MSSGDPTLRTADNWRSEKPRVICAMISFGEGEAAPLVASAHTREIEPSKTSVSSLTGTAVPKPYCGRCELPLQEGIETTYVIWFGEE